MQLNYNKNYIRVTRPFKNIFLLKLTLQNCFLSDILIFKSRTFSAQPRNHLITIIKHHLSCVKNRHFKLAGFFLEAVVETLALVLSCEF